MDSTLSVPAPVQPSTRTDSSAGVQLRIASAFGAFLDPVADKIMVATAMVLLAVRPPPGLSQEQVLMPVLISIMREIAMSSLREWAAKSSSQASKVRSTQLWSSSSGLHCCLPC